MHETLYDPALGMVRTNVNKPKHVWYVFVWFVWVFVKQFLMFRGNSKSSKSDFPRFFLTAGNPVSRQDHSFN